MFKAIIFISTIIFSSNILANQNYKIILGSATPGGFVVLQVGQGSTVEFKEKTINADDKGRVLIGFAREAKTNQQFKLIKENGEITFPTIQIVSRTYNEQRIYGLPKNKVTPDKKTNDKIWQDILKARQARKIVLPTPFFDSGFDWAASGIITGVYGSRRVLNDIPKRAHYGVDIAAPIGTHIYAPTDGKITLKENMVLSGLTIMIDHGYGLRSTLIHLNEILVEKKVT